MIYGNTTIYKYITKNPNKSYVTPVSKIIKMIYCSLINDNDENRMGGTNKL